MGHLPSIIEENIGRFVKGKPEAVRLALVCLFAEGHLLLEDVPGVGKTTLALALARSLDLSVQRIQFTSDLLPADILGVSIFNSRTGEFEFKSGPIFHNVILADEINRSTPKTQSALLEAMNERQVTMENTTRPLPRPFLVIATQNPHEHAGTYPLPESQKDRFLLHIAMGYPDARSEKEILREEIEPASLIEKIHPVADRDAVRGGIAAAKAARVEEILDDYILALIKATRESPFLELGVSPRGALGLRRAAQANAYVAGRDYVTPDDVKSVAVPALAHRLLLKSANGSWQTAPAEKILREILDRVPVPV